ncbi:Macrolide export ATP-binding/permease protein MacB [Symmachiella macrocystis]|uniref:Macrolide export ATP-binding/permease protein MacB n=1 Tax=Symmachiella macrocystis TaxID=2527985 RepID=A0A5C6BJG3_9PLAN|nr:ABC transporter ATP-binding protein [Symmachiella macrocystis]TWU12293.1 Macrolide export ATP-binding/permease protein MacB [Symmachiella macrocystis]
MIEIRDVRQDYLAGETVVHALRGVSCDIPAGAFTFIVGPSGSGKSSLLYLLGALDEPASGEISVNGRVLSALSARQRNAFRRDDVGFIFQNFNLLNNLNAVDNVLVPFLPGGISAQRREDAVRLLKRVGLGDRLEHRPNQLSGGEQQRVAIARALLKRPLLVLADEPTGELDSESGAEIYRHLRELCNEQQSTIVIVTHDRSFIDPADLVLTIRDGQIHNA